MADILKEPAKPAAQTATTPHVTVPHHHAHAVHHGHVPRHRAAHGRSFHTHVAHAVHHRSAAVPSEDGEAVAEAIAKEHVPSDWQASLVYIMAQESGGVVGASNHRDSARGLFQLTRPNYHLNPHGAASFGNATEEVQGGIRYIRERYQTADNAARFWQIHGWY